MVQVARDGQLAGVACVVTGGSRGIGRAICDALLACGASVVAVDVVEPETLTLTLTSPTPAARRAPMFVRCDLSSGSRANVAAALLAAEALLGAPVRVLVNNAGIADELDPDRTVAINLLAVLHGTSLALNRAPSLPLDGCERAAAAVVVVNIASAGGLFAMPYSPFYAASKHGVVGFSRSLAHSDEARLRRVHVHCVCPSFVDTAMVRQGSRSNSAMKADVERQGVLQVDVIASCVLRLVCASLQPAQSDTTRRDSGKLVLVTQKLGERDMEKAPFAKL